MSSIAARCLWLLASLALAFETEGMEDAVRTQSAQIAEIVQQVKVLQAANAELSQKNVQLEAAVAGGASSSRDRPQSYVDTRLLTKPNVFDGNLNEWPIWVFDVRTYLSAISPAMLDLMRRREGSEGEILNLTEDEQAMNGQLYYVLVSLTKGDAKQKLRKLMAGNGAEAWAELLKWYEPKEQQRYASMLVSILQFQMKLWTSSGR